MLGAPMSTAGEEGAGTTLTIHIVHARKLVATKTMNFQSANNALPKSQRSFVTPLLQLLPPAKAELVALPKHSGHRLGGTEPLSNTSTQAIPTPCQFATLVTNLRVHNLGWCDRAARLATITKKFPVVFPTELFLLPYFSCIVTRHWEGRLLS